MVKISDSAEWWCWDLDDITFNYFFFPQHVWIFHPTVPWGWIYSHLCDSLGFLSFKTKQLQTSSIIPGHIKAQVALISQFRADQLPPSLEEWLGWLKLLKDQRWYGQEEFSSSGVSVMRIWRDWGLKDTVTLCSHYLRTWFWEVWGPLSDVIRVYSVVYRPSKKYWRIQFCWLVGWWEVCWQCWRYGSDMARLKLFTMLINTPKIN